MNFKLSLANMKLFANTKVSLEHPQQKLILALIFTQVKKDET